MLKLFSLSSLLLTSLAIGVALSTPLDALASDAGCVLCTQALPQCHCAATQQCIIIPQTCRECSYAICQECSNTTCVGTSS
ncbi:hypothetical protein FB451DRAFT_1299991 [Mycena latifolia]|nr:hypothetical protein FB451DRAFT_1299991 [Mycena latifolia]